MPTLSSALKMSAVGMGVALACVACSAGSPPSSAPSASEVTAPPSTVAETAIPASAEAASTPDCPLSPDEVKQAMGDIVGPGAIIINQEYTANGTCTFTLPPGSLAEPGVGGTVVTGTDEASFTTSTHAYADNYMSSTGVYDVHRDWGGSTPQQVIDSSFIAQRDTTEAQLGKEAGARVKKVPDIGSGAVSDGVGQFTVAGTGRYWYEGGISGVKGSPAYEAGVLNVARLLAKKG